MVRLKVKGRELYAEISDKALARMQKEAVAALPKENGGFLFGYYSDDMTVVYVEQAVLPVQSQGTSMFFERSVHIAQFIDMYRKQLIYIGEWHSHPNGSTEYSARDMQSMIEIAECATTVIPHPLLVIIGAKGKRVKEYKAYMYDQKRLIRYE